MTAASTGDNLEEGGRPLGGSGEEKGANNESLGVLSPSKSADSLITSGPSTTAVEEQGVKEPSLDEDEGPGAPAPEVGEEATNSIASPPTTQTTGEKSEGGEDGGGARRKSKRKRRKVETLINSRHMAVAKKEDFEPTHGEGTKLGELSNVAYQIGKIESASAILKVLRDSSMRLFMLDGFSPVWFGSVS